MKRNQENLYALKCWHESEAPPRWKIDIWVKMTREKHVCATCNPSKEIADPDPREYPAIPVL